MLVTPTPFKGLLIIEPRVFSDARGWFMESWNQNDFARAGVSEPFVQDNQSVSSKHVLRGLHLQLPPFAQGKLVRTLSGSVLDIALDLRKNEPTYGKHFKLVLNEPGKQMLYIPPGFAHGFLTLEENTVFVYKCTAPYNAEFDRSIRWNDPALGIDWGITNPLVSEKDRNAPLLSEFDNPF